MSQVAQRTHIGAYVDPEQREQLIELAQRDDRSVSAVIRRALQEHLDREHLAAASLGSGTPRPSRSPGAREAAP